MDIKSFQTLTGLSYEAAITRLDEQLPADAYTAVPGGADLTDIDPNYMRKVLNEVFGLCGIGWGYEYDPDNMEIRNETRKTQSGQREVVIANLKHLRFWYKITDGNEVFNCSVDASGGSDNSHASYAMKGAITNAIGNAVSNIGFQESVYLGKRSHKTVKGTAKVATPAAKPTAKAAPVAKPAAAPTDEIEEIEPAAEASPQPAAEFIIPVGQRKGQKLADQPMNIVQWYATQMTTGGDAAKEALKQAAAALVAAHGGNGRKPQSTAA